MRNPARLAAELSGRPLLLAPHMVPALARALMLPSDGQMRTPFARILSSARRLVSAQGEDEAPAAPSCYAPHWLGEPDDTGFGWSLRDGVACIEVDGPLMAEGFGWGDCWYHGYDTLIAAYEEIFADARVKAVFEITRSPGGVVDAGLPELAALKRRGRQAAGGVPVWTFARYAYSAAYWLASSSDRILASRESGVGSIGAVITHCDMSAALEKDGFKVTAFKFGARKTDGSSMEPLSDTAADSLQAEVDQAGRWFVADVLAGRPNLTEEAVLATEAGCFYGESDDPALSGLGHGLVDQIMTERAAFAALRELVAAPSPKTPAPPSGGAPAAAKETDMKRSSVVAALKRAGLKGRQLKKVEDELPEDEASEEDDADAENDDPDAEDQDPDAEDQDTDAESDDDDADAENDDPAAEDEDADAEDEDDKVDARTAKAIMDLPQARGREKLARSLAFTSGMTVRKASKLLSAAPRGDTLASRMSGRDPRVTPSGSRGGSAGKPSDRLLAAAKARADKSKPARR